ncbi:ATP-binding cassette domain-containing protein [Aeromonas enteropelogenes]|uniref:ATP-binding cassette domain-containing protein n=1 Tax=Aeromonas enteropelogenes TaxID=29489 RepID=UPI0005A67B8F|nr:ATP-binding cassette domain-containing protein [Aeromonas enteropelogenes]MBL0522762.1 ABC transporter ATP-binding protein [Aeromonas enteropelogenes]UBH53376.1 ATP-binding cassette domain-containing protein [Aeromonas enteropelogenes]
MSAAIRLDGLTKRFGERVALDAISATIPNGGITGLVGPDGAGKSTLLRLLAGLLVPEAGQSRVLGLDPVQEGDALRQRLGYMPQQFGLYEDLSVLENLTLYADLRGVVEPERSPTFARLLAFTDLARFTARPAGKLSGGMKQKLGLACALLGQPEVLLLDEPGVGVDPISRRALWKMVRELAQGGMTVLWSTAYLDEAELCDHVLLMAEGAVRTSGTPADLMGAMASRCWLLEAGNLDGRARRALLRRALAHPAVMDGAVAGERVRLLLRPDAAPPPLTELGLSEGAFAPTPARLEDAFIDLLGGGPGGESSLAATMAEAELPPGVSPEAVIEARHLTKRFGDFAATDDVSFAVRRGEIFGLLGPNGAGKSTTFKMECGLLRPSGGQALVTGIDLAHSPSAARQRLGYMAQKFSLYKQLTVAQNLSFFAGIYGLFGRAQQARIDAMVEAFALGPWLGQQAEALPLGLRQRLSLACALLHAPPLLFLDEPTSGVDPVTRREFWSHINALADHGVTVLVTTHFMDEAEYCDRIALIYRGKLLALGTPDELKGQAAQAMPATALPTTSLPTMEEAFITLVERASEEDA